MTIKKSYSILIVSLFLLNGSCKTQVDDYVKYVDPFIGTGDHGHVFLGANVPFGAVQIGPTNFVKGWDWCSGYHYSDSIVKGFSQTHLSGTGIGDLGDVLITPYTGPLKTSPGDEKIPGSGYASKYSHTNEIAKPGYYAVLLKTFDIHVELTATERVGFHKYTFPASSQSHIAINLKDGIGWDSAKVTYIKKIDSLTYVGYRFSTGWAKDQRLYFTIKLSVPINDFQLFDNEKPIAGHQAQGNAITAILNFPTKAGEEVMLKIGISPTSEAQALNNITEELPGWDFSKTRLNAYHSWNKELGKVKIISHDIHQMRTFYTALYHSCIMPIIYNDHNGDYRGTDKAIHSNPGFTNYTVLSLWDVYRAVQPLYTLIQPERVNDMVNSMLAIYDQQGKLPIWPLMGNETDCMVGYSAVPVIAGAYFKGFTGFDAGKAYKAMKASAMRDDYGMNYIKEKGFIPADLEKESVSKALEYCISDWCIAQMAKKMGKPEDYQYFTKRALAYVQYFDPKTSFMRAKLNNGAFREPFNPFQSIHEWGDYTEGNAWQYTWLVPQDVEGLIRLFGGDANFTKKLDSLFVAKGDLGKEASPDISGLIGQYAHGNEPNHHSAYLYAYAGQQWKIAKNVRYIMDSLYFDKPAGLCGNEDCGQMSAWYVFSALGFYPANPSNGAYIFGSPLFDEATIYLPEGKNLIIKALNTSSKNKYIQSVTLNGVYYDKSYITHKDILKGGNLIFMMGAKPNKAFGFMPKSRPQSIIY